MDWAYRRLSLKVGLKIDSEISLGPEEVWEKIQANPELFADWDLSPLDNSHMLYGYNQQGNPVKLGFDGDLIQRIIIVTKPIETTRYMGVMAYDGHAYCGFQIQKRQSSIQGVLSDVVSTINDEPTLVQGCSRTDTGVHATHYVFHFDSTHAIAPERWVTLLNHRLPDDIKVLQIKHTHPLFHARYDVYQKRYVYQLRLGEKDPFKVHYEWAVKDLDIDRLEENLQSLIGTHDFSSFCKGEPDDPVRTIHEAKYLQDGDRIQLVFVGDGFLRYMIRIIVYALVDIAKGKSKASMTELLAEKSRRRTKHLAPAGGLYLDEIIY